MDQVKEIIVVCDPSYKDIFEGWLKYLLHAALTNTVGNIKPRRKSEHSSFIDKTLPFHRLAAVCILSTVLVSSIFEIGFRNKYVLIS